MITKSHYLEKISSLEERLSEINAKVKMIILSSCKKNIESITIEAYFSQLNKVHYRSRVHLIFVKLELIKTSIINLNERFTIEDLLEDEMKVINAIIECTEEELDELSTKIAFITGA